MHHTFNKNVLGTIINLPTKNNGYIAAITLEKRDNNYLGVYVGLQNVGLDAIHVDRISNNMLRLTAKDAEDNPPPYQRDNMNYNYNSALQAVSTEEYNIRRTVFINEFDLECVRGYRQAFCNHCKFGSLDLRRLLHVNHTPMDEAYILLTYNHSVACAFKPNNLVQYIWPDSKLRAQDNVHIIKVNLKTGMFVTCREQDLDYWQAIIRVNGYRLKEKEFNEQQQSLKIIKQEQALKLRQWNDFCQAFLPFCSFIVFVWFIYLFYFAV